VAARDKVAPPPVLLDEQGQRRFEELIAARVDDADPASWSLFTFTLGAGRRAEALMADVARPHGLDGAQFSVLLVLWMNGPPFRLSPTTLSRYSAQSPSGMTHTVKRLTSAGLVHRVGLESDGRAKHVELTEEGERIVAQCATDLAAAVRDTFASDGVDTAALAASLRQVATILTMRESRPNP
jgi:DNA-binding MarR family transcriptional regulator